MIDRFTHLFKTRNKEQNLISKVKTLFRARSEVDIYANGTSGYKIKHGPNKDKVLGHISRKAKEI